MVAWPPQRDALVHTDHFRRIIVETETARGMPSKGGKNCPFRDRWGKTCPHVQEAKKYITEIATFFQFFFWHGVCSSYAHR
jgi:hypothetical protein